MTASDHLKQRLATGSLGGDQDEKAVEELKADNERIKLKLEMRDGTLNMAVARLGGIVEGNPTGRHNFLQRIDELVAKEAQVEQLQRQVAEMSTVVEAARCIRHWHDASNDGMIVSGAHVRTLWESLSNLDASRSKQG